MTNPTSKNRSFRWQGLIPWGIALLGFVVIRTLFLNRYFQDFDQDPDAYRALAESWSQHGLFGWKSETGSLVPTAFRPPLYPWLLKELSVDGRVPTGAIALLHLILGCATCLIAVRAFQLLFPTRKGWSWLTGWMVAIDPILLRQSALVMTETLATFLAVIAWWLWLEWAKRASAPQRSWQRWFWPVAIGVALGLGALCRPTGLLWGGMWIALTPLLMFQREVQMGRRYRGLVMAIMFLAMMACVTPWATRNQKQLGKTVWMTTHGGYTLLLANNPLIYDHFRANGPSRNWDASQFHQKWKKQQLELATASSGNSFQPRTELEEDAIANQAAWATIRHEPSMFVESCLIRCVWLWAWWPAESNLSFHADSSHNNAGAENGQRASGSWLRVAIGVWYGGWSLLACIGFWKSLRMMRLDPSLWAKFLPMLLLALSLTLIHSVYWSNMRMRAPILPAFYCLAIVGLFANPSVAGRGSAET